VALIAPHDKYLLLTPQVWQAIPLKIVRLFFPSAGGDAGLSCQSVKAAVWARHR
jgi:hypothetical protein